VGETPIHLLVTGAQGQVGQALRARDWGPGVVLHAPGRDELDIADAGAVDAAFAAIPVTAVINAAAYTAVDKAETEVAAAFRANALAPAVLAEAAARAGVPILHLSTDYVFDGTADRPYTEEDRTNPLGAYGQSKRAGEWAVLAANPRALVLRTAWVISAYRANFLKTMIRLAQERDVVRVVDDQRGCPTGAADLAEALAEIARRVIADPSAPTGVYHLANAGETSWAGLAEEVFARSGDLGGPTAKVERITTSDYPTPAARPMNSRLDTGKIAADFGVRLRPWQAAVRDIVTDLNEGRGR
jgi:dTDP-4-dehydrorhamnose reductase